jgi:hypothetical protein
MPVYMRLIRRHLVSVDASHNPKVVGSNPTHAINSFVYEPETSIAERSGDAGELAAAAQQQPPPPRSPLSCTLSPAVV